MFVTMLLTKRHPFVQHSLSGSTDDGMRKVLDRSLGQVPPRAPPQRRCTSLDTSLAEEVA